MHLVHVSLVVLDLGVLLTAASFTARGGHRGWAWLLLLASGAWLPANNGVAEGPVLVGLIGKHGLTLSDLLGISGAVAAGMRLVPRDGRSRPRWLLASGIPVVAVLLTGFLVASFVTDVRVGDRPQHRPSQHHHRALLQL